MLLIITTWWRWPTTGRSQMKWLWTTRWAASSGVSEIRPVYERIFNGGAAVKVAFFDYTIHESGNVFYAVGRERGSLRMGRNQLDLSIRTTRVFKKLDGRWRQLHHHGSIDDPAALATYQSAVRKPDERIALR